MCTTVSPPQVNKTKSLVILPDMRFSCFKSLFFVRAISIKLKKYTHTISRIIIAAKDETVEYQEWSVGGWTGNKKKGEKTSFYNVIHEVVNFLIHLSPSYS